MPKFEVQTDLLIHTTVKVTVEANSKEEAMDKVAEQLPTNMDGGSSKNWKAKVELTAPKGVQLVVMKAHHFEQTSGGEKVRKLSDRVAAVDA